MYCTPRFLTIILCLSTLLCSLSAEEEKTYLIPPAPDMHAGEIWHYKGNYLIKMETFDGENNSTRADWVECNYDFEMKLHEVEDGELVLHASARFKVLDYVFTKNGHPKRYDAGEQTIEIKAGEDKHVLYLEGVPVDDNKAFWYYSMFALLKRPGTSVPDAEELFVLDKVRKIGETWEADSELLKQAAANMQPEYFDPSTLNARATLIDFTPAEEGEFVVLNYLITNGHVTEAEPLAKETGQAPIEGRMKRTVRGSLDTRDGRWLESSLSSHLYATTYQNGDDVRRMRTLMKFDYDSELLNPGGSE